MDTLTDIDLHRSLAGQIRLICYFVMALLFTIWGAKLYVTERKINNKMFLTLFMILSAFFAVTRDERISIYITTPFLILWCFWSLRYLLREKRLT